MPEATLSFTEGDHLLSSAVLPGEIQSVAKQSWWTQAVKRALSLSQILPTSCVEHTAIMETLC